ncbi:dihydroxyacetone kinase phosphoryl donor subunit DhaM [Halalkalibacterium halodurans]|jgi:dihydroxyacetone kinase phosphotransfer subunit|uniref:phosphoenolpyruvate--glycerone phosphotransferase n=1 Tax=Halalkalibacterium halodurans TaxID=86665 RepID=A0A0M0KH28_ALKHA|nr:dihydroxyacetone kinase phosphoryl donor subunit DhaM [Halalkalibacterium halodurans]MDY7223929.1 dihydroxyacetone kinase phosphoryl donor subunit DhaM [Halalkalibacterium halodurans]MDY7243150.1 dihydroxyacetone kinase phosphoryl donor subunit DhaM [Halalkalibacterium halodurans]MED3647866.1 dihydroxyacetone kinase phosphoryl donor subunit DhaM [Halalkalibacterium halodurans]MED4162795.1 dihydroxyacetone kinase phosphoryl donor subunit DhaM [Halalkalibacterium halodurans]TES51826.1 PTS-dep
MTTKPFGIVISSHVPALAEGIVTLLKEVAKDVSITYAGGTDDDQVGASFEKIQQAVMDNEADELFVFYDLGSAKMNVEMVIELSEKTIHLMDVALVEGAYTAAALTQGGASFETITEQLQPLTIKSRG